MMTSFSLPGLPSAFNLRTPFESWAELWASPREGMAAVSPNAERREAKRRAKVLRVEVKFMEVLLLMGGMDGHPRYQKRKFWIIE
jgi:hypothetical protein